MLKKNLLALLVFSTLTAAQVNSVRQYPIDANHSTIGFSVSIMNGLSKVNGKFTDFTVTLMSFAVLAYATAGSLGRSGRRGNMLDIYRG